jgi:uncharacterized glyoxalase superfamily protein PhnB
MKPTPPGWPRISAAIFYRDPQAAIDWLCRAFGFEVRLKVEGDDGAVVHSELTYGDGLIMVAGSGPNAAHPEFTYTKSPAELGGAITMSLCMYVDDVEAHCAKARKEGAVIVTEPKTSDYGDDYWVDRSYQARDPEGHYWWIMQRMKTGKGE